MGNDNTVPERWKDMTPGAISNMRHVARIANETEPADADGLLDHFYVQLLVAEPPILPHLPPVARTWLLSAFAYALARRALGESAFPAEWHAEWDTMHPAATSGEECQS